MKKIDSNSTTSLTRGIYCLLILLITSFSGFTQNIGINSTGTAPNANAGLDVDFANKGLLIPRVALTGTTSASPLAAHVAGMIVYNTATTGDVTPGFYYDNGTRWVASIPNGVSAGDMLYWNGSAWVTIPAGTAGQFLQFAPSSVPTWTGASFATITTTASSGVTGSTASTGGNITADGGSSVLSRGVCYGTASNPTTGNTVIMASPSTGTGSWVSNLTGLTSVTTYYVRAFATNSFVTTYGNQVSFTTNGVAPTLAATTPATAITGNSATTGGNVTSTGGATITERGVCYATTSTPTTANTKVIDPSPGPGVFVSNLTGLTGGTLYYVRAYATNSVGTSYGTQISFTTTVIPPTLVTAAATTITGSTAVSGGSMNWNGPGYSNYQAYGVAYSTSPGAASPTKVATNSSNFPVNPLVPITPWVTNLPGLLANTTYYIRAYLDVYPSGTGPWITVYGNELSFTTLTPTAPVIASTTAATVTSANNATSGGAITNDGGSPITAKGVCWSTSPSPTKGASNFTSDGTGTASFTSSITGLIGSTTYYARAYATNSIGTSYGPADVSFTTWIQAPYVLYQNLGFGYCAYVTPLGTGFIVSYDLTPTAPATKFQWGADGIAVGCSNAVGSGQANTNLILAADLVTRPIAASVANDYTITYNGRTYSDWYLPSAGEFAIMAQYPAYFQLGLGYSTNNYYTSSEYSSLTYATAFFQNGSQPYQSGASRMTDTYTNFLRVIMDFAPPVAPTLTTTAASGITGTAAVSGGNVTNDGGANVTARGVCYSTTPAPTIANSITLDGTGTGVFISNLSGLSIGTTYYIRAYATNSAGTGYGNEITITTLNIPTLTTTAVTSILGATATSGGNITADGGASVTVRGVCWSTTTGPTIANSTTSNGTGTGVFTSNLTGLTIGTTYYVRAYATNSIGTAYGNEVSFTTLTIPTLTTTAITNITTTTATSGGNITSNGGANVTARGVCWSTSPAPTTANSRTSNGTGSGVFTSNITGLTTGVTYYVRAYATNTYGTAYGNELSFTTNSVPAVTTSPVVITGTTAATGGNVTNGGGVNVTARGVVWALTTGATVATHLGITSNGTGTGTYTSSVTGLVSGTTYYLRAYATNSVGTAYGNEIVFIDNGLGTVSTTAATAIAVTTATSGGTVNSDGGSAVTARGVCWNTAINPTTANPKTSDGTGTGAFVSSITGLTQGTLYHVRAYVTNTTGTAYGTDLTFTTLALSAPTVTTTAATAITTTTATTGGNVTGDGNSPVTARGVCYGTTTNPTLAGTFTSDGTGTGVFVSSLTGLTGGTLYYVRAYATNSIGTTYGNQITFTTTAILATVTTAPVTLPTSTGCTSGGNITSNGGAAVTARGVCWSTSPGSTIGNSKTSNGTGNGVFVSAITGLTPGLTYYINAYATNSVGTAYGTEETYMPVGPPTVTTEPIYYIPLDVVATCGGTVVSDGGSVLTASGVVWNTTTGPTITTNLGITNDNTVLGWYSSTITGIQQNVTYYIRAYATNTNGLTSYGTQITFTPGVIGIPSVTTNPINNKIGAIAEGGGSILNDGGDPITVSGVCWSTTANPTTALTTKTIDGPAWTGTFYTTLTGLTVGTVYHVRAYATNAIGTAYGADLTFTETAAFIGQVITGGLMSGNVFSIDGTGLHGLIADPRGYGQSDWGCTSIATGATGTAVGTGPANTTAIINSNTTNGCVSASPYIAFAAEICKYNGTDWYLPSKDEFSLLWTNQVAAGISGNMSIYAPLAPFWCSSEVTATTVWHFDAVIPTPAWNNTGLKTDLNNVWPIRSF